MIVWARWPVLPQPPCTQLGTHRKCFHPQRADNAPALQRHPEWDTRVSETGSEKQEFEQKWGFRNILDAKKKNTFQHNYSDAFHCLIWFQRKSTVNDREPWFWPLDFGIPIDCPSNCETVTLSQELGIQTHEHLSRTSPSENYTSDSRTTPQMSFPCRATDSTT